MSNAIIPIPRISISIRPATMDDLPFIDGLQKIHTKQVGWMPTKQFEGKIKLGHVLVAEEPSPLPSPDPQAGSPGEGAERVGYCIGNDQYFKRDDVGIIYQMNVVPGKQRGFVGASLLKAQFERSAYGCKLYCCWCAQDIEANHFWESLGFVPLAFRAGSRGKGRVHIFWQRRIREGDTTTPYWFPSQTNSGSIREDRLVLPIPPETHWSDAKPLILPGDAGDSQALPAPSKRVKKDRRIEKRNAFARNGMWFDIPRQGEPIAVEKPKREPKKKVKNDPRLVAAARELRDRWMEKVNAEGFALPAGKYDVSRAIEVSSRTIPPNTNLTHQLSALPAPVAA
jgi:hypothetical protein